MSSFAYKSASALTLRLDGHAMAGEPLSMWTGAVGAIAAALALTACASRVSVDQGAEGDSGPAAQDAPSEVPPPEEDPIRLTLPPFWDIPVDENGIGEPESLEGVKVCVVRKRRYEESWDRFVETDGPCSDPTVANEPVVLDGVPAMAELILTAEKEGYAPRAFAAVTDRFDQTVVGPVYLMHLFRLSSFALLFPSADPGLGQLVVMTLGISLADSGGVIPLPSFLDGVTVSLTPDTGDGPFYARGGVIDPDATTTLLGSGASLSDSPYTLFTNLTGREYLLRAEHPNAACTALGGVWGYPEDLDVLRAPVLDGFYTEVIANCTCRLPSFPNTCTPLAAEAGVP